MSLFKTVARRRDIRVQSGTSIAGAVTSGNHVVIPGREIILIASNEERNRVDTGSRLI